LGGASPTRSENLSGLLCIHLDNCANLKNVDMMGKSDPYVTFRLGSNKVKSDVVDNNLNPKYNADFQMEFANAQLDVLHVEVYDHDTLKIGKSTLLGNISISLEEVFHSNSCVKNTWPLTPQGSITMELRMLFFS
jgi:Ca2+-dependent lipid-binding protein